MLDPRTELIERHDPYVRRIVTATIRTFGLPKESIDEYLSAAYMGLIEASERFDETVGGTFEGFAFRRIRGAVIDMIRNNSDVTGASYKAIKALRTLDETNGGMERASANGSAPDDEMLRKIFSFSARGFLAIQLCGEKADTALKNLVDGEDSVENQIIRNQRYETIQRIVKKLPDKERYIVEQHYFHGKAFSEIVDDRPDLSKSWVSRLHTRALDKLASLIHAHGEL